MAGVCDRQPGQARERAGIARRECFFEHSRRELRVHTRFEVARTSHVVDEKRAVPVLAERGCCVFHRQEVDDLVPDSLEQISPGCEEHRETAGQGERAANRLPELPTDLRRDFELTCLGDRTGDATPKDDLEDNINQGQRDQDRQTGTRRVGVDAPVELLILDFRFWIQDFRPPFPLQDAGFSTN